MTLQDLLNRLQRIAMEDPNRLDVDVRISDGMGASVQDIGMVMFFDVDTLNHHPAHITIFAN